MGAGVTTERVKFYKKNFMSLHEKGYKIPEIADMCSISRGHAYMLLQEIADENGVTREELLTKNWKKSQTGKSTKVAKILVDGSELQRDFENVMNDIEGIVNKINNMMEV